MTSAKLLIMFGTQDSFTNLKQLVSQERFWNFIRAGVPQGFILGPLLFLLFINDIVNGIDSNIRLFADDTSLFIIVDNAPYAAACLNFDLDRIT